MSHSYLITGASRGLGAEFVRQLLERGHTVFAALRDPRSADATARAGAKVLQLDVDRPATFEAFARSLDVPLDVLVNNAAIAADDDALPSLASETMENVFRTNVVGPALLTRALLPLLRRGNRKVVVNVSSGLGSLAATPGAFSYSYCASKSALNMLTVLMSRELARDGFTVVSLDPGWNRTDMGGAAAPLDPRDSVQAMVGIMERLQRSASGTFLGYDGSPRPW